MEDDILKFSQKEIINEGNALLNKVLNTDEVDVIKEGECTVHLVTKDIYHDILKIKEHLNSLKLKGTRTPKDNFFLIAKLLNKNDSAAYKYELKTKEKYVLVTDPKLIKDRMEQKFIIWKNRQNVICKQTISEKNLTGQNRIDFENEVAANIKNAEEKYNFVIENYEDFKATITTFEKVSKRYQVIYFTTKDKETHQEHLRNSAFNILYYENDIKNKQRRSNKIVDQIIANGINIFGDCYVEKVSDKFWEQLQELENE